MHSALFILELLFRTFSDPILASQPVGEEDEYPTEQEHYLRRHPLLSLALCCKTFSPVALHVLWREIDGIDQLLWTMSDDIIKITLPVGAEEREDSGSETSSSSDSSESDWHRKRMTFKKQPVEQDWEPFDRYGALVTNLGNRSIIALGDPLALSPNVLEALNARYELKGKPLLPNLKSMTCLGQQLRYAHTLLGPHLHFLSIPQMLCGDQSYDLRAFLQLARFNPPARLNYLSVYNIADPELEWEIDSLVSEFVTNIQQKGEGLQTVRVQFQSGFSLEALKLVITNERTREIRIDVEQFDLDRVLPPGTPGIRKDLHTVRIRAAKGVTSNSLQGHSFFHEFFQRLNAPNLVALLFLGGPRYTSVHDARAIFTLLHPENAAENNIDDNHTEISILPAEPLDDMTTHPTQHICTFANSFYLACQPMSSTDPTPRFADLQALELNVLADLTDSDIGSLSSSMPRLVRFHFETRRAGRTERSRMTLIGIWLLAKNCRVLETMGIWFNAVLDWEQFAVITQLNVSNGSDQEGRRSLLCEAKNTKLQSITIGDSNIGDTDMVIEFFENVCPRLERIYRIGEEDREGWEAVRAILTGNSDDWSSSYVSQSDYGHSESSDDDLD